MNTNHLLCIFPLLLMLSILANVFLKFYIYILFLQLLLVIYKLYMVNTPV